MKRQSTDPHYEFRVFGHDFGQLLTPLLTGLPLKRRFALANYARPIVESRSPAHDEGRQTYLLATGDQSCSIKIRNHKLDTKVLLRQQQGLERWQPYLQLAFPLTAAFLHEFLFAWLEVTPPPLQRTRYTEEQCLKELIFPHPMLYAVQVHKERRCFTVNGCDMEITALTVNGHYHTHTVAVEAAEAEVLLDTLELLGLHTFPNTNYLAGLRQLVGLDSAEALPWAEAEPVLAPTLVRSPDRELVLAR